MEKFAVTEMWVFFKRIPHSLKVARVCRSAVCNARMGSHQGQCHTEALARMTLDDEKCFLQGFVYHLSYFRQRCSACH